MISLNEFLKLFPFFKLDIGVAERILSKGTCKTFPAGTILQAEGDSCYSLEFMLAGGKRVYTISDTGREITLYEVEEGEICIINAACILSDIVCPVNANAITDVETLRISAEEFRLLVSEKESMRSFVFHVFGNTFVNFVELIHEVIFRKMDERLQDYLLEKSENGLLQTSHLQIASDLGTAREVVSRLLKDFERKGYLELSRNRINLIGQDQ